MDLAGDVWHSAFLPEAPLDSSTSSGNSSSNSSSSSSSSSRLEQLLVALLGSSEEGVRLEAVKLLNAYYDRWPMV